MVGLHFMWNGLGGGAEGTAPLFSSEVPYGCLLIETSPPFLSAAVYPNSAALASHSKVALKRVSDVQ